jgi:hypothetical protein
MKITEARLRQILREESRRVRLFEALGDGGDIGIMKTPTAASAPAAPAVGLIPLVNGKPVGGRFILGNQPALQKYSPHADKFLLPNGEFKSFGEMCREIGGDIHRGGTTDSGGVTLIESGAYYIGLAGYKSPTLEDLRQNSGKELEGTELSNVLNLEEEDTVNGQDFFQRFNMAFDAGAKDRNMPGKSPAAQPAAGAPAAGAPAASGGGIARVAGVDKIQEKLKIKVDGQWGPATQSAVVQFMNTNVKPGTNVLPATLTAQNLSTNWKATAPQIVSVNGTPVTLKGTPADLFRFMELLTPQQASTRPPPVDSSLAGAPGGPAEGSWRRGSRINESERRVRIAWGR